LERGRAVPERKKKDREGDCAAADEAGKSRRPSESRVEEGGYLKQLVESGTTVRVKMGDGEEVIGVIEYYDQSFIRLTRDGEPNLFIFKHDIKYIAEAS